MLRIAAAALSLGRLCTTTTSGQEQAPVIRSARGYYR